MEQSGPPPNGPLILVADDVAANVELLFDQLHVLGFRAVAAYDGPSALQACFEHRPDLCILDVSMPAGDLGVDDRSTGFEVCRRIKRDPRTKSIPVIFVTALSDTTDRVKAIEAGGDDFLTKPHNRLVLGARVRSLLKLKAATDALEESYRKLREVEKMRDDLMKMIVHDLKTPLTAVLATTEMLRDGDFGAGHRPAGEGALRRRRKGGGPAGADRRPARGLAARRSDDHARSPADRAGGAVRRAGARMGAALQAGGRRGDGGRQRGRAGLRGRQGAVDARARQPRSELRHAHRKLGQLQFAAKKDGDGVLLTVADNGPGIPEEYHELIFRKFERVKNPSIPRTRSSGLGLAFCKLVIDAHGGRIWVRSAGEGMGSAFHMYLPIHPPSREVKVSGGGLAIS